MSVPLTNVPDPMLQRFMNALGVVPLRDSVDHGPGEIKVALEKVQSEKDKLLPMRKALRIAQEDLANADAELMAEIMAETGEKDKPVFSNESARKAELARRRKRAASVIAALALIDSIEDQIARCEGAVKAAEHDAEFRRYRFTAKLAQLANTTALLEMAAAYKGVA